MATGASGKFSGAMAPADVPGAGQDQWGRYTGVPAMSVLVGGPGHDGDVDNLPNNQGRSAYRIVTNDASPGPLSGSHLNVLDDWRDVLNFKGSPVPWLLLMSLAVLGLMQFRLMVRAGGKKGATAAVGLG